jgi:hypothetical protein
MPHVVFQGTAELKEVWSKFAPQLRSEGGWITKITDCYLSAQHNSLLFESTAVFRGVTHNFYVRAELKQQQITVRIEPRTNVEKNEGVKWAVAMVAKLLRQCCVHLQVEKSNLPDEMLAIVRGGGE